MNITPILLLLLSTNSAHAWNWGDAQSANNPVQFETDYEYHYQALPLKGASKTPWSEVYWPSKKGSINYRWNADDAIGFQYKSPTREEIRTMSLDELKELSPSEKYDLAMGHYDYPFKKSVDEEMADKKARYWEGICNGWAPAALYYSEPKPVEVTNPDGIVIPFGSSDVKALLSYFMAIEGEDQVETSQIGLRCDSHPLLGLRPPQCDRTDAGINAGALHVILANEIGIRNRGFVANITQNTKEIWNQPVFGYEMEELGSVRTKHADHGIRIRARIFYGQELVASQWEPVVGTELNKIASQSVEYILELNRENKIIGGEWITKKLHPDFIWRVESQKNIRFKGNMEGLNRIYQPRI